MIFFPLVPTCLVKGSCARARPPLMTAGPCFQTAVPATWFLSPCLEPRCNCDPARVRASRGDVWPGLGWGRDLPSGGPGSREPRRPLPPCLPLLSLPFGLLRVFLLSPPARPHKGAQHFSFLPLLFFLSYFSLALSLSSTISFLFNRSLRWPHVEIAGPREAKPGFVGIRGNLTGSLRPPRRRGGVAIGRASA